MARFTRNYKSLEIAVLMTAIFTFSGGSFAQDEHRRIGWWGNVEAGIGYVDLSSQDYKESDAHFYLGFSGGYIINTSFLLGIELSGWLYESSNLEDPREGKGISQVFAIARYYPSKKRDFFIKAGCGYVTLWDNSPSETEKLNGPGLALGVGYDYSVKSNWSVSPFITYNYGDMKHQEYNSFTLGIAVMFH